MPLLFVALFAFGVIAALFGPIKYGILPDPPAREELPAGNALVEGATFLAILLGTIIGGGLAAGNGGDAWLVRRPGHGLRRCAGSRPADPADRRPRPTSSSTPTSLRSTAHLCAICGRRAPVGRRPDRVLVLARRRRVLSLLPPW